MLTVDVRSRVEPELKREAAAVLKASGLYVKYRHPLVSAQRRRTGWLADGSAPREPTTLAAIKAAKANKVSGVSLEDL